MDRARHRLRSARALFALSAGVLWLAGCTTIGPAPTEPPTAAAAAASAPVESARAHDAAPAPDSAVPDPGPPAPPPAVSVAILYSGRMPAQAAIAARIADGLAGPAYAVHRLDIDAIETAAPIDPAVASVRIVAAVGPAALDVARNRFESADIVFSQVLEPEPEAERDADSNRTILGVAPMPPPALQFAAWAVVDPELRRIGVITGAGFARTVPAARSAAAAIGAELVHRVSTSDRETLYLFRRLAGAIDGLWLSPDSGILSAAVIDEILARAAKLDIGVLVFTESLLDRGGLISVGAPPEHVARTVIDAIERIGSGRAGTLPDEIPLTEGAVRVNARVAAALDLPAEAPTEWMIHDRD